MLYLLRHLASVLILPTTVTIVVPVWITGRYGAQFHWPGSFIDGALASAGAVVGVAGLTLFAASLHHFFTEGRGTLAPWDPPRRLVVRGPYRYVRNPMISGVIFILAGIALVMRSVPHAKWALLFLGLNLLFIPLLEEPDLEMRFGDDYRRYRSAVPRFIPRYRPWVPEDRPAVGS
jgi:protein-S-isoprenylcysteine O-methyltransferase Ste14